LRGAVIRGARCAGAGERGEEEWWAREAWCGARERMVCEGAEGRGA
jgi:hypothetical protein